VLHRWPHLRPGEAVRAPDPATWRLTTFTARVSAR
jgi:hypothetical protein